MSNYLQTTKPKRQRVPPEANWGQAYTIYRRTGMDHSDAAYRADEREKRIARGCPYCRRSNCATDPCSTELQRRASRRDSGA